MQHRIRFARTDNLSTVAGDRLSYKLEDGQPFYDKSANELYIGKDLSTLLSTKNKDIPAFKAMMYKNSNIVVSDSGAQIEDFNVSGNNTIIGFSAGSNLFKSDANALNNVVIGQGALENLKNGDSNIAIGSNSMGAITSTTKLDGNIAVGNHAMQYTKGNNNVSIGTNSNKGSSGSDTSLDNTICLGTNSQCSVSNTIQLGEGTNSVSKSLQLWDKNIYQYNNGNDNFNATTFTGNLLGNAEYASYASEDKTKGTIEERLTLLGFKQGVCEYTGANETVVEMANSLKKQGKYVICNLTIIRAGGGLLNEGQTITITIPSEFRPKETTSIPLLVTSAGVLSGTFGFQSDLSTDGILTYTSPANTMAIQILNSGWEIN